MHKKKGDLSTKTGALYQYNQEKIKTNKKKDRGRRVPRFFSEDQTLEVCGRRLLRLSTGDNRRRCATPAAHVGRTRLTTADSGLQRQGLDIGRHTTRGIQTSDLLMDGSAGVIHGRLKTRCGRPITVVPPRHGLGLRHVRHVVRRAQTSIARESR
jgi:hypothetical protein